MARCVHKGLRGVLLLEQHLQKFWPGMVQMARCVHKGLRGVFHLKQHLRQFWPRMMQMARCVHQGPGGSPGTTPTSILARDDAEGQVCPPRTWRCILPETTPTAILAREDVMLALYLLFSSFSDVLFVEDVLFLTTNFGKFITHLHRRESIVFCTFANWCARHSIYKYINVCILYRIHTKQACTHTLSLSLSLFFHPNKTKKKAVISYSCILKVVHAQPKLCTRTDGPPHHPSHPDTTTHSIFNTPPHAYSFTTSCCQNR